MSAAMCAICFDFLLDQHENCVVPCGHVFHQKCLSKWFISKRNCPNCQKEVAPNMTVRIFINFHNDQLLNVSKIEKCDQECKDIKAKNRELKTKTADLKTQVSKAIHELNIARAEADAMRQQRQRDEDLTRKNHELESEIQRLQAQNATLQTTPRHSPFDISEYLKTMQDLGFIKGQYESLREQHTNLENDMKDIRAERDEYKDEIQQLKVSRQRLELLHNERESLVRANNQFEAAIKDMNIKHAELMEKYSREVDRANRIELSTKSHLRLRSETDNSISLSSPTNRALDETETTLISFKLINGNWSMVK